MTWTWIITCAWAFCSSIVFLATAAAFDAVRAYPTTLAGWLLVVVRIVGGPVTVVWMLLGRIDDSGDTRGGQP